MKLERGTKAYLALLKRMLLLLTVLTPVEKNVFRALDFVLPSVSVTSFRTSALCTMDALLVKLFAVMNILFFLESSALSCVLASYFSLYITN